MFEFFKRKKEETVSRALYDAVLESRDWWKKAAQNAFAERTAARAEAEANKVDAEKYRRSRANLKQYRMEKA